MQVKLWFKRCFLSPLLYALSTIAVFVLMGIAVVFLERSVGLHTWRRVGDIDAVAVLIAAGIPVFFTVTRLLVRFDELHRWYFHTHLRHCALLYLSAILLAAVLVVYYQTLNAALQYAYVAGLFASCVLAILTNGITLFLFRRRR